MGKLTEQRLKTVAPSLLDLIHIVDVDDLTDSPEGSSVYMTLETLQKIMHNVGFFDYNDLATTTTPIAVTAGTSPVKITNDAAGDFTNKDYAPEAITDIWDDINDTFDFTELALGDMIDIRCDIEVTTTVPNQHLELELRLAVGAFEYTILFQHTDFKSAGTHHIVAFNGIYMGDTNTLDNGAYFEISSDADCSVKVNGWYSKIIRK